MMAALAGAVLTASLLGSTHCAGMCGAFAAFATSPDVPNAAHQRPASRWSLNLAYNGGRLATYIAFGLAAGALGAAFDLGGSLLLGLQRTASLVAAGLMISVGTIALLKHFGVRIGRAPVPGFVVQFVRAGHLRAFELPALPRAFVIGLLTTFLPCGWLYTFVLVSAGTADPMAGALMMAIFWIGTLPVMAAVGFGAQMLSGSIRPHLPLLTNLALICTAIWMVIARIHAPIAPGNLASIDWKDPASDIRSRAADEACPLCSEPDKAVHRP